jgi:SpoVK/Ycf46/Vps4 family AAA+-type ATPase
MGGRGGAVWRGSSTEDADTFLSIDEQTFTIPDGLLERLVGETIDYLDGPSAALLRKWGEPAKRGVVLYGPPGNGKTVLTRLCAQRALVRDMNVVIIEGRRRSRATFDRDAMGLGDELRRAVSRGRALLVFEDIDLHCARRHANEDNYRERDAAAQNEELSELLDFLDGVEPTEGYALLATTNYIDRLDPALRRTGRIDVEIEIAAPTQPLREAALAKMLQRGPNPVPDPSVIAPILNGFSFSDLAEAVRRYKILAANYMHAKPQDLLLTAAEDLVRERSVLTRESAADPEH